MNIVRHPTMFTDQYNKNDGNGYFLGLMQPWLYTPLLSPSSLLLALPTYLVNVLSSQGYTQELAKHYVTMPFVAAAFSSMRGVQSRGHANIRRLLAIGIVAMTIWSLHGGTGPWGDRYASGIWGLYRTSKVEAMDRAVAQVPDGASASASFMIVPHLTRRDEIYAFPNPWAASNWGINDENPPDPHRVDWVVLDLGVTGEGASKDVHDKLVASPCWRVVSEELDVQVLHRVSRDCPE